MIVSIQFRHRSAVTTLPRAGRNVVNRGAAAKPPGQTAPAMTESPALARWTMWL
jgi:hypothetical protein